MSKHNHKIPDDVLDILNRSEITESDLKLPEQLSPEQYKKVKKVIELAGGKWNRSLGTHVFQSDPREQLGMALDSGEIVDKKKKFQQFYTPREVAERALGSLDVTNMDVLDPSAGGGMLLDVAKARGAPSATAIEIDIAAPCLNKYQTIVDDFLAIPPPYAAGVLDLRYDLVFMNPPFSGGQDIKHVLHAMSFVKPGGHLIAIMWPNEDRKKMQEILGDPRVDTFETEKVEAGAFAESGTDVPVMILRLKLKPEANQQPQAQKEPMNEPTPNETETPRDEGPVVEMPEVVECLPETCSREIPLDCLHESPFQRRTDYGDLDGLAASIKERGILTPAVIRAKPVTKDGYEIIAGHRRWKAAALAGKESMPCRIIKCDDVTAEELVLIDNAQRKDLSFLELVDSISALRKKSGLDIRSIAGRLALPVETVRNAVAMDGAGKKLTAAYESSLDDKGRYAAFKPSYWALLARLPVATQDKIIDSEEVQNFYTFQGLKDFINREYMMKLESMPWDKADATFACGACVGCLKRSDASKDLFPDLHPLKKKQDARCLDPACFGKKKAEHLARKLEEARKEHGEKMPVLTTDYNTPAGQTYIQEWQLKDVVQDQPGKKTIPVFLADEGRVAHMKVPDDAKSPAAKAAAKAEADADPEKKKEAKLEMLEARRWKWVSERMRDQLLGREGASVKTPDWPAAMLLHGLVKLGGQIHVSTVPPKRADLAKFLTSMEENKDVLSKVDDNALAPIIQAFKVSCAQAIFFQLAGDANRKELEWTADWWQFNLETLFAEASEAIPTPKSLVKG